MILAVDCGNTHTKIGCIEQGTVIEPIIRIETNHKKTLYEYASDIDQILKLTHIKERAIDGVIISCVVPTLADVLAGAMKLVTGKDAIIVGAGVKTGLKLQIDDPGTIAADLVSAAVAAKNLYPLPAIIINMGTATTVTVVDKNGAYIGGVILPGVVLSMNALATGTSLLPSIDVAPSKKVISTQTMDAMRSGIIYGSAGAVDGILERFEAELGGKAASIVATGGVSHLITSHCHHNITLDEDLLLKGLWHIWKLNAR